MPHGSDVNSLLAGLPIFLAYTLSYINVGIFWNNHHHMLHAAERVNGKVLWANLFLLFWLSLVPFVIRWIDETGFIAIPTAAYGVVLGMAAIGYVMLQSTIISCNGQNSRLAGAVGRDWKGKFSIAVYMAAIPSAFLAPWISIALYVLVAVIWFAPDRRIETGAQV